MWRATIGGLLSAWLSAAGTPPFAGRKPFTKRTGTEGQGLS
jgi:hypothetical protein